ncbi:TldD/PmbA family protein [Methanolobus bombayensis]|uniref:TldD/PmbA family protein n=1 Tax=Methanolobus bombayensis TaxID=38023 RepID=UPI001AEB1314|nr:TldD/PmbA family protein [Methanolobus bombayensis]MBP1910386.1 PmbA protein [Methanolobus bombayensis]
MYDLAEKALKAATKFGAKEAEVYIVKSQKTSVNIQKDMIEGAKENITTGIGIRAIINGAVGFSSTNIMSYIDEAAKNAVSSAKTQDADPDWKELPSNQKYPTVSGILDREIQNMELDECIDHTMEMMEAARKTPGIIVTSGSFSRSYGERLILNTNGVEVSEEGTGISGFVDVITNKGETSTAYDFAISRKNDIDFGEIGKNAAGLAKRSQDTISVEPHRTEVILHPFAFSDLIENTFIPSIDSDNVQKGRSSLIGRKDETIANEKLSIYDDGLLEGGIDTGIADDEGVASRKTTVIENGVFKSYLYDTYTAGKDDVESTGNASRNSYLSTPSVGSRNFIVDFPTCDIIADTDNGIYVNTVIGAHTANSISGDFSVEARNAFTIKDGKLDKPIKSLMISGNIFEMLKNITGAGRDVRKVGGTITPSVRISDMSVVG